METSTPFKFNLKKTIKEVIPVIENIEDEDSKIAKLSSNENWIALRERIERKIEMAKQSTELSGVLDEKINNFESYGIKCALKELVVEALESIIDDVEKTAKYFKENNEK